MFHKTDAVCIAENRFADEPVAIAAIASAAARNPRARIIAFVPNVGEVGRAAVSRFENVELRHETPAGVGSYDVKPYALLSLLDEGYPRVWWIDSDVISVGNAVDGFSTVPDNVLFATEEAAYTLYADDGDRAKAWGFEVARAFGFALNSGVLRVGQCHRALLRDWAHYLERMEYKHAQSRPWHERPRHMLSDQDVLTALLCGRAHSGVETSILRRGRDIVQYFGPTGYSVRERISSLVGRGPLFVHAQGYKPWKQGGADLSSPRLVRWFDELMADASPHSIAAEQLGRELGLDVKWARARRTPGKLLRLIGMGRPELTGLPLAIVADVAVRMMRVTRLRSVR